MTRGRTNPLAVPLPGGWGRASLRPAGSPVAPGELRARDHLGWTLAWRPSAGAGGARFACDVEHRGRLLDPLLEALVPTSVEGVRFWVLAELCAKLATTPILIWLQEWRRHGWRTPVAATDGVVLDDGIRVLGFGMAAAGRSPGTFEAFFRSVALGERAGSTAVPAQACAHIGEAASEGLAS